LISRRHAPSTTATTATGLTATGLTTTAANLATPGALPPLHGVDEIPVPAGTAAANLATPGALPPLHGVAPQILLTPGFVAHDVPDATATAAARGRLLLVGAGVQDGIRHATATTAAKLLARRSTELRWARGRRRVLRLLRLTGASARHLRSRPTDCASDLATDISGRIRRLRGATSTRQIWTGPADCSRDLTGDAFRRGSGMPTNRAGNLAADVGHLWCDAFSGSAALPFARLLDVAGRITHLAEDAALLLLGLRLALLLRRGPRALGCRFANGSTLATVLHGLGFLGLGLASCLACLLVDTPLAFATLRLLALRRARWWCGCACVLGDLPLATAGRLAWLCGSPDLPRHISLGLRCSPRACDAGCRLASRCRPTAGANGHRRAAVARRWARCRLLWASRGPRRLATPGLIDGASATDRTAVAGWASLGRWR
jgi:hypothetical protein